MVRRGRPRLAALSLATHLLGGGCQAPSTTPTEPAVEASGDLTYSLCPSSGGPIDAAVTAEAIDVLKWRLADLGISESTIEAETCISVRIKSTDDPDVGPALLGTGHIELLVVPPDQVDNVTTGMAPPEGLARLAADGDFTSAGTEAGTSGSPNLLLELAPDAARALAAWSSTNVGGASLLVVDGVIVATPIVMEPITDGHLVLSLARDGPVPARAIAAMVTSGPLPEEWAQAENPQG